MREDLDTARLTMLMPRLLSLAAGSPPWRNSCIRRREGRELIVRNFSAAFCPQDRIVPRLLFWLSAAGIGRMSLRSCAAEEIGFRRT